MTTARPHRTAHVITRLELGGAQQNTLFCTARHDRERYAPELLSGAGGLLDADALAIPDATVRLVPWLKHAISPWWDLVALLRLRAYFKERRIDLVHTHSSKAGVLGRLAARLAGVPVVVHTIHGWSFNPTQSPARRRFYTFLERLLAPLTDRLIAVSSRDVDKGLAHGIGRRGQYVVLHSGIDIERFARPARDRDAVRRELKAGPATILVGTITCLKPQKAPLDFVRAAAAAHREHPDLRFFIAGDGALAGELRREIRRLQVEDVVLPLGWRRDVVDLLHAMDVFLLTSLFEGLPRVVLQAMAAGVPVVATDVDGTPEVVQHGRSGLLVPPGRPDLAAQRLLELAADPALRDRFVGEGRRRLTADFDIHRMVADLDELYDRWLNDDGAGEAHRAERSGTTPRGW